MAQAAYFHANKKKLEKQGVDVAEWDKSSKGKKLPKKVKGGNTALSVDSMKGSSIVTDRADNLAAKKTFKTRSSGKVRF